MATTPTVVEVSNAEVAQRASAPNGQSSTAIAQGGKRYNFFALASNSSEFPITVTQNLDGFNHVESPHLNAIRTQPNLFKDLTDGMKTKKKAIQ